VYIFVGPFARRVRSSMKVILLDAIWGSYSSEDVSYDHLDCDAVESCK
jgi:hypothetical protein